MRFSLLITPFLLAVAPLVVIHGNTNHHPHRVNHRHDLNLVDLGKHQHQQESNEIVTVRRRSLQGQASSTCPTTGMVQVAGSGGFQAWNDTEFRKLAGPGPDYNLIYRRCDSCADSHKDIFYKRLTPIPDDLDFLNLFLNNWNKGPANVLGIDFRLFSSIDNAIINRRGWQFCTYDGRNVGFPKSCSPNFDRVNCQWNSLRRPRSCSRRDSDGQTSSGASYAFYVICDKDGAKKLMETSVLPTPRPTVSPLEESAATAPSTSANTAAPSTPKAITTAPTRSTATTVAALRIITPSPNTFAPTSRAPITPLPSTSGPTTRAPTTAVPTTLAPTTQTPTLRPSVAPTVLPVTALFSSLSNLLNSLLPAPPPPIATPLILTAYPSPLLHTSQPTPAPTSSASTLRPTVGPTFQPTTQPTTTPTTALPTSSDPTLRPTVEPTNQPSAQPSNTPTTSSPSSLAPTRTLKPTVEPTNYPSATLMNAASTNAPSTHTLIPTTEPTESSEHPTEHSPIAPTSAAPTSLAPKFNASLVRPTNEPTHPTSRAPNTSGLTDNPAANSLMPNFVPNGSLQSTAAPIPSCVPDEIVYYEDFEQKGMRGWDNGRLDSCSYFTQFLGRYFSGDASFPHKTYTDIPTDASTVTVEFDFYEIDVWGWQQEDRVVVNIDGVDVPLGPFRSQFDDGTKTGVVNGVSFQTSSYDVPAERCFGAGDGSNTWYFDQKHHVTMVLPSRFIADGALSLDFKTPGVRRFQAAGFDNIRITVQRKCDVSPLPAPKPLPSSNSAQRCVPDELIFTDDFETQDLSGWTDGKLDSCKFFSNFLGRIRPGDPVPHKTYSGIPTDALGVTLEFDFYKIDVWGWQQQDHLTVIVNGIKITLGTFHSLQYEREISGLVDGVAFEVVGQGLPAERCFDSGDEYNKEWYYEERHYVRMVLSKRFIADGNLTIGFETPGRKLFQAAGIDNIGIIVHRRC